MGPQSAIFGVRVGFKNCFGVYSYSGTNLFYIVPSVLTIEIHLILGPVFTFLDPNGLFSGSGKVEKLFWGLLM